MHDINEKTVEKKLNPSGRELWLEKGVDGAKTLLIPYSGGRDKVRVDLLKRLREIATLSSDLRSDGLLTLEGVRSAGESILLEFQFVPGLWDRWEVGFPERLSPEQAAGFLQRAVHIAGLAEREKSLEFPIHPSDLVDLGTDGIGFFDPRIGLALEDVAPVQPARELCLPPEIIQGKPWSEQAVLYTAGLAAYTKLGGVFPFGSENLSEAATSLVQEVPLDIRCHQVETAAGLALLIQWLIEKKPERRPDMNQAKAALVKAEKEGFSADAAAQQAFMAKTAAIKLQQQRVRQSRRAWLTGRWIALAVVAVVAMGYFLMQPGYHPRITRQTPPAKVVEQFYRAYADLNIEPLQETLFKTGKDVVQTVSMKFVLSRYTPDIQARKVLQLQDLKTVSVREGSREVRYAANYRLISINGFGKTIQEREDALVLRRVKEIWRIVDYRSVVQNERFIKDPNAPKDRVDKLKGLR